MDILSDDEITNIHREYWLLYFDLWFEGVITKSDFLSGFNSWSLEAQAQATTNALLDWMEETCPGHPPGYTTLLKGACSKCRAELR